MVERALGGVPQASREAVRSTQEAARAAKADQREATVDSNGEGGEVLVAVARDESGRAFFEQPEVAEPVVERGDSALPGRVLFFVPGNAVGSQAETTPAEHVVRNGRARASGRASIGSLASVGHRALQARSVESGPVQLTRLRSSAMRTAKQPCPCT